MCPERTDVVSDMAWSSVAVLGDGACLIGEDGPYKSDAADVAVISVLELGTKTVFRTSRRPRIVPAFRLIPGWGARYIAIFGQSCCSQYVIWKTHHPKGVCHIVHSLLSLAFIFEDGLIADRQVHARVIQAVFLRVRTGLSLLKRGHIPCCFSLGTCDFIHS